MTSRQRSIAVGIAVVLGLAAFIALYLRLSSPSKKPSSRRADRDKNAIDERSERDETRAPSEPEPDDPSDPDEPEAPEPLTAAGSATVGPATPTAPTTAAGPVPHAPPSGSKRVDQLHSRVLQDAVTHNWVPIDDQNTPCPPDRIKIVYSPPSNLRQYTKGAYFEPLGPAPGDSTAEVNGMLICEGYPFLYRGFEGYYRADSGRWDVFPFPVIE